MARRSLGRDPGSRAAARRMKRLINLALRPLGVKVVRAERRYPQCQLKGIRSTRLRRTMDGVRSGSIGKANFANIINASSG